MRGIPSSRPHIAPTAGNAARPRRRRTGRHAVVGPPAVLRPAARRPCRARPDERPVFLAAGLHAGHVPGWPGSTPARARFDARERWAAPRPAAGEAADPLVVPAGFRGSMSIRTTPRHPCGCGALAALAEGTTRSMDRLISAASETDRLSRVTGAPKLGVAGHRAPRRPETPVAAWGRGSCPHADHHRHSPIVALIDREPVSTTFTCV